VNAHIVIKSIWDDWVISRLAKLLVDGLGWGYGKKMDPSADINIFFPYLEWRFFKPTERCAAWVTHQRESEWGQKIWQQTNKSLTLRVTPSAMYARRLAKFGPTAHIPHPVQLDMFTIGGAAFIHPVDFTVGVSGTVYKDGRKGEDLVKRLVHEKKDWQIVGSGRGWPCPTTWWNWEMMPMFYRGLNCFLCTSTIEGGPVTMLEALACGIPIVIPAGVGQCDELPDMPGIYHYEAGNYDSMLDCLHECSGQSLRREISQHALRRVVEPYTAEKWCADWKKAVEKVL